MHACIHANMHSCMHAYIHTYMHTCIHGYMHTCIHAYLHIQKQVRKFSPASSLETRLVGASPLRKALFCLLGCCCCCCCSFSSLFCSSSSCFFCQGVGPFPLTEINGSIGPSSHVGGVPTFSDPSCKGGIFTKCLLHF